MITFGVCKLCAYITVPSSCTTGNVTLVDGDNEMEGRVEVCRGGVWGAVYDDSGWNFNDAQVTCRQLGYPSECELVCICEYIVLSANHSSTLSSSFCSYIYTHQTSALMLLLMPCTKFSDFSDHSHYC